MKTSQINHPLPAFPFGKWSRNSKTLVSQQLPSFRRTSSQPKTRKGKRFTASLAHPSSHDLPPPLFRVPRSEFRACRTAELGLLPRHQTPTLALSLPSQTSLPASRPKLSTHGTPPTYVKSLPHFPPKNPKREAPSALPLSLRPSVALSLHPSSFILHPSSFALASPTTPTLTLDGCPASRSTRCVAF
jgi:hypothetical protein